MKYFADLHIHSRFARATSKNLTLPALDEWARKKGIQLLGTGDFTHPYWFGELKEQLEPAAENGLYVVKNTPANNPTRFLPTVEISSIYSDKGRTRRIHSLVMLPSLEMVKEFNKLLSFEGNLRSDGRPILGTSAKTVAQAAFKIYPEALIIPAHAWTPWFSVFGSMSGYDSLLECYEELAPKILAIETGLSSDPPMNWRLRKLDDVALISNSDAHSANKLGREATEFEGELSYAGLREALRTGAPARVHERADSIAKIVRTIEFFPEEGKYHYDGHRVCKVRWTPEETKLNRGRCSSCKRPVTVGVMSRVDDLGDRDSKPSGAPDYLSVVPLEEVVAEGLGQNVGTKAVVQMYDRLLNAFNSEFHVLMEASPEEVAKASEPIIGEAIKRMRAGELNIIPGYDGEFGIVKIFKDEDRQQLSKTATAQSSLF